MQDSPEQSPVNNRADEAVQARPVQPAARRADAPGSFVVPAGPAGAPVWMQAVLVIITLVVFAPVLGNQFLHWDDWDTVAKNPAFNPVSAEKVARFWIKPHMSLYQPLTMTVWGVAASIAPEHPPDEDGIMLSATFFHGINLGIHCLSVLLVLAILRELLGADRPAFFGALIFGLHPVMVEPVAWMSGMKDVLYGCLCLASILFYIRAVRTSGKPEATNRGISLALFVAAALAKPSAVGLPVILFMLDWTVLRRDARLAWHAIMPWLAISIPVIIVGMWVQKGEENPLAPVWSRLFIAGDALAFDIGKLLWPRTLTVDYGRNPTWLMNQGAWMFVTSALTAALLIVAYKNRFRFPMFLAGLGVLIGAALPVLGFIPFEFQGKSTVSDHYLYLGPLGLALIAAEVLRRWGRKTVYVGLSIVLVLYAGRSFTQIGYWRDIDALRGHQIAVNPKNATGYQMAAFALARAGRYEEAIQQHELALRYRDDVGTHYDLANAMYWAGIRPQEALEHYKIVLEKRPNDPAPANNAAGLLISLRRYDQAEVLVEEAIRRDPDSAEAHANLGELMRMSSRFEESRKEFAISLRLKPNNEIAVLGMKKLERDVRLMSTPASRQPTTRP